MSTTEILAELPRLTPQERERLYFRQFRRVLLRRFPYKVFYQIIGERVIVFRVLHGKQNHERRVEKQALITKSIDKTCGM